MKVIVADDSMLTRKIVIKYLAPLNFEAIEASNGSEVMEILNKEENLPNLILMDWNMPEMDGIEVLEEIQKNARLNRVPVIMLTSESDELSIETAMKAGARAYITKPFTAEQLVETIKETIR